jgi:hypothetical protein
LKKEATLFSTRKAWWYIQRSPVGGEKGSMGAQYYTAPNPPFGAVFTYYLGEKYKTLKDVRKENEKKLNKENKNIPFPGWDILEDEQIQEKPRIILTVKNSEGNIIRKLEGDTGKGFHRIVWDLRASPKTAIKVEKNSSERNPVGIMIAPGKYTVTLSKQIDGVVTNLSEPMEFEVEQLREGVLKGSTPEQCVAFWNELETLQAAVGVASISLEGAQKKVKAMKQALSKSNVKPGDLDTKLYNLYLELQEIESEFFGNKSKSKIGEKNNPTVYSRLSVAQIGTSNSTYGPTPTHKRSLELAGKQFSVIKIKLTEIINNKIPEMENELIDVEAPWIEGQKIP